ncbi:MAG: hypothetical protein EPO00_10980 [Chloroflexota bacterium]|nr:MAG: hypothetical protein EPO00_10980 [Chloroflexota bacterium]
MRQPVALCHRFVDAIPDRLQAGVLYVSMRYRTAVHLCPTGCGEEVVTPLGRDDWTLTFDGTVSLRPSVGNWGLACRSHYWITRDAVVWAATWSREQVARWREGAAEPAVRVEAGWQQGLIAWIRGWIARRQ